MISNEIIYHFQYIKKDLFVESFASEVKANLIKDFLVFDTGKISLFCFLIVFLKVPLGRKFIGLFRPNSVAEYRVLFIFPQKTEQQTFHPNIFSSKVA